MLPPPKTMHSCELLRHDHQVVGNVLDAVEGILGGEQTRRTRIPRMPLFTGATEFFSTFVERCHQAKEEQALFPALADSGILDGDSLRASRGEHAEGRRLLLTLRPLCARRASERDIEGLLGSYLALQRRHMAFEDASVLPRAQEALSPTTDARIRRDFTRIEERVVGPGGRAALLALGGALAQACRALGAESPPERPDLTARDVLRGAAGTVARDDSLSRADEQMEMLGTRELPVVEGDALVGILTRTDMEPYRGHLEWTAVRTAMTPDPVAVAPDTPIRAVARLLRDRGFNAVPVATDRRLVGMIRRSDLLPLLAGGEI